MLALTNPAVFKNNRYLYIELILCKYPRKLNKYKQFIPSTSYKWNDYTIDKCIPRQYKAHQHRGCDP